MSEETKNNKFIDKFTNFAFKLGSQIHLRSLRDAFATIMPIYILAGLAVLVNNVFLPWFISGDTLANVQYWGTVVVNGTLNVSGLFICAAASYSLARNKNFKTPFTPVIVSVASLIIMMPQTVSITPVGVEEAVSVNGVLSYTNLGTTGMFAGIIIGLMGTALFIKLSSFEKLKINLGENVPPAVGNSFNMMFPFMLTLIIFGLISAFLHSVFSTDLITLISTVIQEPLRKVNTSLLGCVLIYSLGNFLFTLGIHQSVINGVILEPLLIANINDNMIAYANGEPIPHIINNALVPTFGMIGGTGSTLCLLIATFIFSKLKQSRDVAKLSIGPGLFNINEPVIFGYPIIYNLPLMIPFVLLPAIGIVLSYAATALGFMNYCVFMPPWTTPPLLNAWLATAGDCRAIVVQLIIIVLGVFLYLPFMKMSESIANRAAEATKVEEK